MINVEEFKGVTRILGVTKKELDLDKTFNCGQSFRWKKQGNYYTGIIGDKVIKLAEHTFSDGEVGYATTLSAEECRAILLNYLSLNIDYNEYINIESLDDFAKKAAVFGQGIRILKQDPWEALITFLISQRNNIPKITSTVERLCVALGNDINGEGYSFPTPEKVIQAGIDGLQNLGLGYRDQYILNAAKWVYERRIDLHKLESFKISGEEAVTELMQLYGVGPKVANCVALFGLGKYDMFPIDIWIQRIIDQYYDGNIDISKYGCMAGLVQQYMFYYIKHIE